MKNERDNERGAVTVLTAVCMVVLLMMVAMVIDAGMAYAEKAQLQNGADAAALAVAGNCAKNPASCTAATQQGLANSMANRNSNDGSSSVSLDITSATVTATTSTVSGGNSFLSMPLSAITGFSTAQVRAQAAASWGGIYSGTPILPLTVGACELDPTKYPMDGTDRVVAMHGTFGGTGANKEVKCSSWNPDAGLNMPGGFGWLDTTSSCQPNVTIDNPWVDSGTGNSIPTGCTSLFSSSLVGQTVLIPIFGYADGTGATGTYKILGWGVFVVKGWNFPSTKVNWPSGSSTTGLYGHFTKQISYAEGFTMGGTTTYGATQVNLVK
ncbi:TadE/TadG family type IV pilus assembly protein [Arthrobacter sp. STN4]|uniref:TadE/TadG family type IV pilus assembly protein n=1 Tax=Arthrobacter sp. STN4 TaxID=2923276 RepID=UPI00211AA1E3|nr:Tad domain-containing protein [Arthrobacter sp. STN4]MCQ9163598.1 Tad domain-containing protein [Arthrobacter sp. STN4]